MALGCPIPALKWNLGSCKLSCFGFVPAKRGKCCSVCVCVHLDFLPWEWPEQTALSNSLLLNRWGYWPSSISIFQGRENEIALFWLGGVQCINKKNVYENQWRVHENHKNLDNLYYFSPGWATEISLLILFFFLCTELRVCSGIA